MADQDLDELTARKLQGKFDFYFIALEFTLLGLAIQTATFGVSKVSAASELLGWVFLLASGLYGLSRLEWQPQLFQVFSRQNWHKEIIHQMKVLQQKGLSVVGVLGEGRTESVSELRETHEKALTTFDERAEGIQKRALQKYLWQRVLFVVGLIALMIARGLPHAVELFGYVLR